MHPAKQRLDAHRSVGDERDLGLILHVELTIGQAPARSDNSLAILTSRCECISPVNISWRPAPRRCARCIAASASRMSGSASRPGSRVSVMPMHAVTLSSSPAMDIGATSAPAILRAIILAAASVGDVLAEHEKVVTAGMRERVDRTRLVRSAAAMTQDGARPRRRRRRRSDRRIGLRGASLCRRSDRY